MRKYEAKKEFITCQECDEKVPFIDFIGQRLKSDPVARKIAAFCSAQKVSGLLRFWRRARRRCFFRMTSGWRSWGKLGERGAGFFHLRRFVRTYPAD
jgi:hypothetical protein